MVRGLIHRFGKRGYGADSRLGVLPGVDDIWLTSALTAQGYDPNELARLLRRGELARVRRGAYASAGWRGPRS